MVEKLKKSLGNIDVLTLMYLLTLMDLSKAFDCLRYDLLIAKLAAYGLDQSSLCLIFSYFSDKTQRIKVNNAYSSYTTIKYGVPQGSILGPLLFNSSSICDLFLWDYKCDIACDADDNTSYTSHISLILVLEKVQLIISLDCLKKTT